MEEVDLNGEITEMFKYMLSGVTTKSGEVLRTYLGFHQIRRPQPNALLTMMLADLPINSKITVATTLLTRALASARMNGGYELLKVNEAIDALKLQRDLDRTFEPKDEESDLIKQKINHALVMQYKRFACEDGSEADDVSDILGRMRAQCGTEYFNVMEESLRARLELCSDTVDALALMDEATQDADDNEDEFLFRDKNGRKIKRLRKNSMDDVGEYDIPVDEPLFKKRNPWAGKPVWMQGGYWGTAPEDGTNVEDFNLDDEEISKLMEKNDEADKENQRKILEELEERNRQSAPSPVDHVREYCDSPPPDARPKTKSRPPDFFTTDRDKDIDEAEGNSASGSSERSTLYGSVKRRSDVVDENQGSVRDLAGQFERSLRINRDNQRPKFGTAQRVKNRQTQEEMDFVERQRIAREKRKGKSVPDTDYHM